MANIKLPNNSFHGVTPSSLSPKTSKHLSSPFTNSALLTHIKHTKPSGLDIEFQDDISKNQTTLGSDYAKAIKQNISIKKLDSQESSQAVKNAKAFYKIYVESEAQSRRLKFLQSRQKKRNAQTPDVTRGRDPQYINQLAEKNLRLFRNMNQLMGIEQTPKKNPNDNSLLSWDDNGIVKPSIRSCPTKTKKPKFSIMDVKRDSLFIPSGASGIEAHNVSDISGSNIQLNQRNLATYGLVPNRNEHKQAINLRRVLTRKQSRDNNNSSGKGNTSIDFHMNKGHNSHKNKVNDIFSVDSENSLNHSVLPRIGDYKAINEVTQQFAIECNTSSPINKKTVSLMGKLIKTGIFKENESDKVNKENGYGPKYRRPLMEKQRRSTSVAS